MKTVYDLTERTVFYNLQAVIIKYVLFVLVNFLAIGWKNIDVS